MPGVADGPPDLAITSMQATIKGEFRMCAMECREAQPGRHLGIAGLAFLNAVTAVSVMMGAALLSAPAFAQSTAWTHQPAEWEKIVAGARKEGFVRFYSLQVQPSVDRTVAGFKKAHPGIGVEVLRGAGGVVNPRVDMEMATGADGGDVLVTTEVGWLNARSREGRFLNPAGPSTRNWPAALVGEGGRFPIVGYELFVIPYNKAQVKSAPQGYADLLRPEFKGKLGTPESTSASLAAWYEWLEKTQGSDFLARLRAQNPKLFVGSAPLSQAIASGELAAGLFSVGSTIKPIMENGAPVDFVVPNPSFAATYGVAAFSWARRPNAALLFVDYVMSIDGQTAWHGKGDSASSLKGIQGSMQATTLSPYNPEAYPAETVKKYNERWDRIFR